MPLSSFIKTLLPWLPNLKGGNLSDWSKIDDFHYDNAAIYMGTQSIFTVIYKQEQHDAYKFMTIALLRVFMLQRICFCFPSMETKDSIGILLLVKISLHYRTFSHQRTRSNASSFLDSELAFLEVSHTKYLVSTSLVLLSQVHKVPVTVSGTLDHGRKYHFACLDSSNV